MNRTALRLASLAAMTHGGTAPFPTIARDHVFDSRQDPIEELQPNDRLPVVIIRTDEDQRTNSTGAGTPTGRNALKRAVELRLEIGVVTALKDETGSLVTGWPESDAALEAMLDLLEFQVEAALRGHSLWAEWFKGFPQWGITDWMSAQIVTDPTQGAIRLAARDIRVSFWMGVDCFPKPHVEGDPGFVAPAMPVLLTSIFDRVAAAGGGDVQLAFEQIRDVLEARTWPVGAPYPPLETVSIGIPEAGTPPVGQSPANIMQADFGVEPED